MTPVLDYHQTTKHSFHRFARSLGYLDWAAQPDPFRRYAGCPQIALPRQALRPAVPYGALFDGDSQAAPVDEASIGEFLRCSIGLSAWKQHGRSRWALRVNPSSGNLHPTECYVVYHTQVCHYAPADHVLEVRATGITVPLPAGTFLVGLTSILWREAWKYGERAFRYCQHDIGHALGALRFAASLLGWRLRLLEGTHDEIAEVLGVDRDVDRAGAEREEPECLALVGPAGAAVSVADLRDAARSASWTGTANRLSPTHVEWPVIDTVAAETRAKGDIAVAIERAELARDSGPVAPLPSHAPGDEAPAREIILRRRSALGFDARSSLPFSRLRTMLRRVTPPGPPWDAIDWPPQVHLVLFVHRVDGLLPGLYAHVRDVRAPGELRAAMHADFLWERVSDANESNLFLLAPLDVRFAANRLSCDQDIASDGFLAAAMVARMAPALRERGDPFYRRLFWECGLIGQALYLEAEAAGARATGIGCFYDDAVHDALGLSGMEWQSLYHFSMGVPVDDARLTTEPGYPGGW